ncbi:hypothetical protein OE903_20690 [Bacillus sp. B6(2022)]|nr:hypothetical protein [Bacillus sp. B6(2022)]
MFNALHCSYTWSGSVWSDSSDAKYDQLFIGHYGFIKCCGGAFFSVAAHKGEMEQAQRYLASYFVSSLFYPSVFFTLSIHVSAAG